MTRGLRFSEVERLRNTPSTSLLLFLTDRCPVECAHCSVESLRNSPSISDYEKFRSLMADIASISDLRMVGISGGEPFAERKGLQMAVEMLREANLNIVLYTSGYWAKKGTPAWVEEILAQVGTVFISPDAYHTARLGFDTLVRAMHAVVDSGASVILQLVQDANSESYIQDLLTQLEPGQPRPEINLVPLLPYGRSSLRVSTLKGPAELAPCRALDSPVVRYDGKAIACCNEGIIMGRGPKRLNTPFIPGSEQLAQTIQSYKSDAWLGAISSAGPSVISGLPQIHPHLNEKGYRDTCDFCWQMQTSLSDESLLSKDKLLKAVRLVYEGK
jgi:hypothetical protein